MTTVVFWALGYDYVVTLATVAAVLQFIPIAPARCDRLSTMRAAFLIGILAAMGALTTAGA